MNKRRLQTVLRVTVLILDILIETLEHAESAVETSHLPAKHRAGTRAFTRTTSLYSTAHRASVRSAMRKGIKIGAVKDGHGKPRGGSQLDFRVSNGLSNRISSAQSSRFSRRPTRHSCRTEFRVSYSKQKIGVTVTRHSIEGRNFLSISASHRTRPLGIGAFHACC